MNPLFASLAMVFLAASFALQWWAWRTAAPSREITRLRAERAAAKASRSAPAPTPPSRRRPPLSVVPYGPRPPLFPDPPRSIHHAPRPDLDTWCYVRPGRTSLDWSGPEWDPAGCLEFEQKVMQRRTYGTSVAVHAGEPIPPQDLIGAIVGVWRNFVAAIAREGVVVDKRARVGVLVDPDTAWGAKRGVTLRVEAWCWPAVEDVTVARRPGWQDVTL